MTLIKTSPSITLKKIISKSELSFSNVRLKLLQAVTLLENKDKSDGKIKGDKTFYNNWKNPVSVSQYHL